MSRVNKVKLFKIGMILSVLSCVSACGQKGSLYHPPSEASVSSSSYSNTV